MSTLHFYWMPDPKVHAAAFDRVSVALMDRIKPLAAAEATIQHDIQERFQTETDPAGNPWQDWSESYKPKAELLNLGILWQSGDLYDAATSTEATMISRDTVFYNTQFLPHFGLAHDQGLPERKNPLPQREFLGMSDEAASLIMMHFTAWFDGAISFYPTASGKIGRRHSLRDPGSGQFIKA